MTRAEIEDAMETIGDAMDNMKKGTAEFMAASAEYRRLDDLLGDVLDAEIDAAAEANGIDKADRTPKLRETSKWPDGWNPNDEDADRVLFGDAM